MSKQAISKTDFAASLAAFLLEKKGSVLGSWRGKLTATEQRSLFGRFLGKGTIIINGTEETLIHRIKVCFGLDWEDTASLAWRDL